MANFARPRDERVGDAAIAEHRAEHHLRHPRALRPTATVELLRQHLSLARWCDVESQQRREHHGCAQRAEGRVRGPEAAVHLVDEALVACIEAARVQERGIGNRHLTPAARVRGAVQHQVRGGERVRQLKGQRRTLGHAHLQRVE